MSKSIYERFGAKVINDPGGDSLIAESPIHDAPKGSRLIVPQGRSCLAVQNGTPYLVTGPFDDTWDAGQHRLVQSFQNEMYGANPQPNAFYYFNTSSYAPKDIVISIGKLLKRDSLTGTIIPVYPKISIQLGITNILTIFNSMRGYRFSDEGIATMLQTRVGDFIKNCFSIKMDDRVLLDVHNEPYQFLEGDAKHKLKEFFKKIGLTLCGLHLYSLDFGEEAERYFDEYNKNEVFITKVNRWADSKGLDTQEAAKLILQDKALQTELGVGLFQLGIASQMAKGLL